MKAFLFILIIGLFYLNSGFSQETQDSTNQTSDTVETDEIEVFTDKPNINR